MRTRIETLAVLVGTCVTMADQASAGTRVILSSGGPAGSAVEAAFVVAKNTVGRGGAPLSDTVVGEAARGEAILDLAPGTWIIGATAPGYWAAPEEVDVASQSQVTLRLWPTAAISGRLTTPEPRGGIEAAFFPIAEVGSGRSDPEISALGAPPASTVPCTVAQNRFTCEVPAWKLDVQLRANGVGSHFIWDLHLMAGKPTDVGQVALRKGAFVAGWVRDVAGLPAGGAVVELLAPDGAKLHTDANLRLSAIADARGFFQVGPVKVGSYLAAFRRDGAEILETPLQVTAAGQTYVIEPFVVGTVCRLQVALSPPLDPWGEPWSIDLLGYTGERPRLLERSVRASRTGQWAHKLVTPARYVLGIFGQSRSQWHTQRIELADGHCERLEVEIPTVSARGILRPPGKWQEASLTLVNSLLKVRIPFAVDGSGNFSGFLPAAAVDQREGWSATLDTSEPRSRQTIQEVELEPDPVAGGLRVSVAVSSLSVSGVVLDRTGGRWMDDCTVSLQSSERNEPPTQARMAPSDGGRFELSGFPPGRYTIWAEAGESSSRRQTVEMEKDSTPTTVELVLEPGQTVRGRVRSAGGTGIPGAVIVAFPPENFMEFVAPIHSGADGSFELRVPPGARRLAVRAQARGFAYELTSLSLQESQPLTLALEPTGGTLIMESTDPLDDDLMTHVLREGSFEETRGLREWAAQNGTTNTDPHRLVIPQMAAGGYLVCRAGVAEGRELFSGALPNGRCVRGTLAAGADLTLTVPGSRPARR